MDHGLMFTAMGVIPLPSGGLHLAVEAGVGGTTYAMQAAREVLDDGGRVLWTSEELPDRDRFSQVFEDVSPIGLARFHAMKAGIDLAGSLRSLASLAEGMASVRLVVVDDWAGDEGRPPAMIIELVESLLTIVDLQTCTVLVISSAYEDASGEDDGAGAPEPEWPLRARQAARLIEAGYTPAWLRRGDGGSASRRLWIDGDMSEWRLTTSGYEPW